MCMLRQLGAMNHLQLATACTPTGSLVHVVRRAPLVTARHCNGVGCVCKGWGSRWPGRPQRCQAATSRFTAEGGAARTCCGLVLHGSRCAHGVTLVGLPEGGGLFSVPSVRPR